MCGKVVWDVEGCLITMAKKSNCVLFAIEMEMRFSFPTLAPGYMCSSTPAHTHARIHKPRLKHFISNMTSVQHMSLINRYVTPLTCLTLLHFFQERLSVTYLMYCQEILHSLWESLWPWLKVLYCFYETSEEGMNLNGTVKYPWS